VVIYGQHLATLRTIDVELVELITIVVALAQTSGVVVRHGKCGGGV
jgi:hypothetical protein